MSLWSAMVRYKGEVIGVVGIIVAVYAMADAREKIHDASADLGTEIKVLEAQTSTHSANEFPHNMQEINRVLSTSNASLKIAMDVPGYGLFSQPDEFRKMLDTMESKSREGVVTQLVLLGRKVRQEQMRKEFTQDVFDDLKAHQPKKLHDYLTKLPQQQAVDTLEQFLVAGDQVDDDLESHMRFATSICEVDAQMPLFVWISDDREAVFSIASLESGTAKESSITTRDPDIVKGLAVIFKNYQTLPVSRTVFGQVQ